MRIAMWSGPRNISTALMRAWENRPDTFVSDEPFYAHYLLKAAAPHPGAEEVIRHHETDWRKVIAWLTGPIPEGRTIWYQKHMSHHLLPEIDRNWIDEVTNCFLIRDPLEMIASYIKHIPNPRLEDLGLPQQVEIFELVRDRTGVAPIILDAKDVLTDPEGILGKMCERLGIAFNKRMLHWPPGPRNTDGVWAKHWYQKVEQSTGFEPYRPRNEPLPDHLNDLLEECNHYYRILFVHRLEPN